MTLHDELIKVMGKIYATKDDLTISANGRNILIELKVEGPNGPSLRKFMLKPEECIWLMEQFHRIFVGKNE